MLNNIGIDIIEIDRIDKLVSKSRNFLDKVYTDLEIEYIKSRNYNPNTIAGLFSAKEAISKVLGTGIRGFRWKDIEISHDVLGKPMVTLKGNAEKLANSKGIGNIHLSISHNRSDAISIAIGTKVEKKSENNTGNFNWAKGILIDRKEDSNKGSYGRVGIIAGSKGMVGAAYLSSKASLRTGSGLVYSIVPESISTILQVKSIENIIKSFGDLNSDGFTRNSILDILEYCKSMDAIAIGPGIGVDEDNVELVEQLLHTIQAPIVLDADGINCVSNKKSILLNRNNKLIITPHPGELSRLINISIEEIQNNREKYSMEVSKKYGVIVVLKGNKTIVCNNEEIYINTTGNPGMATAGSGDVLTGIIVSLLGQGIDSFTSAKLGVFIHGLAGDIARDEKGEYSLIASDIIENIPLAINKIRRE